jgi:hypothetical protein
VANARFSRRSNSDSSGSEAASALRMV